MSQVVCEYKAALLKQNYGADNDHLCGQLRQSKGRVIKDVVNLRMTYLHRSGLWLLLQWSFNPNYLHQRVEI